MCKERNKILSFDIIIEIINFFNERSALKMCGTSRFFKIFIEKLPCFSTHTRIIPELNIFTMFYEKIGDTYPGKMLTFPNETYASLPGKMLRPGYYGRRIWRRLPLAPPPTEIVGFSNISIDFYLKTILRSADYVTEAKHFFQNIKQLLTSSTHYLNVHFDNYDYACSHNFLVYIKFPRISEIPEFNVVLSWLKLFDVGAFPFVNITSSSSMLFSYSAHSEALFSQLLNSQHLRNVKFLRIQNDFYCWHHYPYPFPLKLSSIAKWLFISEGPKIIRFFNEDNPGKLDCICPIETFLIPMLISLLETTNWKNYSYLIIHPTCVYCFNFIYVVQHSKLSHYLRHILVYTNDYLALWLHTGVEYTTEKFELIWYDTICT